MIVRLENKAVLVVGAGEHLGRSAPLLFAQEGAKVVIAARRQHVLEETAQMIDKEVKPSGNSGRVYLPPDWVGKHVKIIRID